MSNVTAVVLASEGGITSGVWFALVFAAILLIANAFFVALEFALVATQRSQLEAKVAEGNPRAKSALAAITDLNTQIAGAQLGITIATIGLGYLAEPSIAAILEWLLPFLGEDYRHLVALVIAYTIVTYLHLVIGEMVPKNLALVNPAGSAMRLAGAGLLFVRIFRPLLSSLNLMASGVQRLLGVKSIDERNEARTPAELASLIEESRGEGVLDDFEHSLLSGTLDLRESTVGSQMVPWDSVALVAQGATIAEIEQVVLSSGHSRLPMVADGNVLGWVHAKDLMRFADDQWDEPYPVKDLHAPLRFTATMNLEQVLLRMQRGRRHFALVIDTEGHTVGVITLEDVLESVVGDIVDETDMDDVDV